MQSFDIASDHLFLCSRNDDLFLSHPVDIREIRELRLGKASRDFERYPEEARKVDSALCFIVLYGLEFRLRTLSLAGRSACGRVCVGGWWGG